MCLQLLCVRLIWSHNEKNIHVSNLTNCAEKKFKFFKGFWLEKLGMIFDRYGKCWILKCMLHFTIVTNYCKEKPTVSLIFFSCGLVLGGLI